MPRSLPSLHCADLIAVGHTARWNESSALQISSSSSAAGAGADRGAHGAARSVSPSTGHVRVTKEILDQKRRELLNLKKRASEPTALLSNASPTSFYTSGSPPLSTPPSRSSPVPGSGSPPPSLTPAGKPKSPPPRTSPRAADGTLERRGAAASRTGRYGGEAAHGKV